MLVPSVISDVKPFIYIYIFGHLPEAVTELT